MKKYVRNMRGFLFAMTVLLVLSACSGSSETPAPTNAGSGAGGGDAQLKPLKVGAVLSLELNSPVWVALTEGYYEEAGLQVELSYMPGGIVVRDAVAAKDIDIGLNDTILGVMGRSAGLPISIIGDWYDAELWELMVSKQNEGTITSVKDLKGKVILTSPPGSSAWAAARIVLKKEGLNPDTDVQFLAQPDVSPETWLNLLEKGDADAAMTWEPHRTFLENRGAATSILSLRNQETVEQYMGGQVTTMGLLSHDDVIKEKQAELKAFIEATNRGIKYIQEHSAEDIGNIIAPYFKGEPEVAIKAIEGSKDSFKGGIAISKGNYERRARLFEMEGIVKRTVSFEEGTDTTFAGMTE